MILLQLSHKFNHKFHGDVAVGWKGNADESTLINMQWFVESMMTTDLPNDLWPLYFFKLFINNCRCSHQFLSRSNKSLCTDWERSITDTWRWKYGIAKHLQPHSVSCNCQITTGHRIKLPLEKYSFYIYNSFMDCKCKPQSHHDTASDKQ